MSEPLNGARTDGNGAIRTLIVDDEALARRGIELRLATATDFEIVGQCGNAREAAATIDRLRPDLLFLDIQMPGLSGFDLLTRLPQDQMPIVVFVTAYDQYALQAFEVHAVDYVLKPFDGKRLLQALDRARTQASASREDYEARLAALVEKLARDRTRLEEALARVEPQYLERATVRVNGRVFFIRLSDVDWIESAHNYARLHVGGEQHLLRVTLSELAARLDPRRFARIHRFTIVNLDRIREVQPSTSGDQIVILHNGQRLRMSRSHRSALPLDEPLWPSGGVLRGARGEG